MKKVYLLVFVVIMNIFPACEKEDNLFLYSNPTGLIHQVLYNSELAYEYTYNDANQVIEEKSRFTYTRHNYQDGRLKSSDFYIDPRIYSSDSRMLEAAMNRKDWVSPANTDKNSTRIYFYDDSGTLIKTGTHSNDSRFSYDDHGRIIRQTFYQDDIQSGYIDFFYDASGNISTRLHYGLLASGEAELKTTTEYEFDNKHNPWKAFSSLMLPGQNTNINNIIKETYTIHFEVDPFIDTIQITENSYRYNTLDYPVSKNDFETYVYYE
jgi:YD repeat-containing protein